MDFSRLNASLRNSIERMKGNFDSIVIDTGRKACYTGKKY